MINAVTLVGRLTRDPELKKTNTGKTVSSFTLACDKKFGNKETDFVNCVVWDKQAEFLCNYLKKGSLIGLTGRIQSRNFEGSDGKRVYVQEVVVESLQSLEFGKTNNSEQQTYTPSENEPPLEDEPILDITSDDLPF